jgi:hypothetical protein
MVIWVQKSHLSVGTPEFAMRLQFGEAVSGSVQKPTSGLFHSILEECGRVLMFFENNSTSGLCPS